MLVRLSLNTFVDPVARRAPQVLLYEKVIDLHAIPPLGSFFVLFPGWDRVKIDEIEVRPNAEVQFELFGDNSLFTGEKESLEWRQGCMRELGWTLVKSVTGREAQDYINNQ